MSVTVKWSSSAMIKCDKCDKPATNKSVVIIKGQKIPKNLCDEHQAQEEGIAHKPINELVTNMVKQQSGATATDLTCAECGMTFTQFREHSLLGCPACYATFEAPLMPLLERAHEGGTHHVGKVPRRAGASEQKQVQLLRLRKTLSVAVANEDFETAAKLRDQIRKFEETVQ
jgi:protein arginine kinase activator